MFAVVFSSPTKTFLQSDLVSNYDIKFSGRRTATIVTMSAAHVQKKISSHTFRLESTSSCSLGHPASSCTSDQGLVFDQPKKGAQACTHLLFFVVVE